MTGPTAATKGDSEIGSSVEIRNADSAEAARLTEIAFAAKRFWRYPDAWIEIWRDELTIEPDYIANNRVLCAIIDGEIIGWCGLVLEPDCAWIEHCWVDPPAIGRGIGRRLLDRLIEQAHALGAAEIKTIADPNAADFYAKAGFRYVGEHPSAPPGRMLPVLALRLGRPPLESD